MNDVTLNSVLPHFEKGDYVLFDMIKICKGKIQNVGKEDCEVLFDNGLRTRIHKQFLFKVKA